MRLARQLPFSCHVQRGFAPSGAEVPLFHLRPRPFKPQPHTAPEEVRNRMHRQPNHHSPRREQPRATAAARPLPAPGSLVILAALAALALMIFSFANRSHAFGLFGGPKEVKAQAGNVAIPLADVSDGKAHFYTFRTGGKLVQFFVLKSRDGQVRTALNACDVCYREKKGYVQEGDTMKCVNCGMRFASVRIGEVKGGCNPHPLPRTTDSKNLLIREADLAAGVGYF